MTEEQRDKQTNKLLEHINKHKSTYQSWLDHFASKTYNSDVIKSITNQPLDLNNIYKITTLSNATSALALNINGNTVYIPLLSAI